MKNQKPTTVVWTLLLVGFIFHGVLENSLDFVKIFDEIVALLCFPFAAYDYFTNKREKGIRLTKTRRMELGLLLTFLLCGLAGNILYRFQPLWVVLVSAVLAAKFFMILLTAGYIQKFLKVDMEKQEDTIQILSILWFGYYMLSLLLPQYFEAPEAWDICAKSSLLFALLIFSTHKRIYRYRLCLMMMLVMLVLSGKEKAYGAIFVLGLFYYLIVHKKVQTKIRYILYMAIPVAVLAWDKIYYYYVQGYGRYAKSIMTSTSLQIAKDYFPIGTGFGTFGSTYAREVYSPVYFLYGIADNPELGIESRQYLTDLFWPILFGETGVLGTIFYCGLILLLFIQIQRVFYYNKKKYFLLIFMFVFMMMTTFTEAGFMQPMVMVFAYVMGMLLEEYEEKRKQKMKYFE
ncbi:MAG: O-antigen ligase family protein [Lachnospiraceae bacterium]